MFVSVLMADFCRAADAKQMYFEAEACTKTLEQHPERQQYRENWLSCIKKFQNVYMTNPVGPWAAAGLYQTGRLYYELYQHSYRLSDKLEAIDIFRRIRKRYASSAYCRHAVNQLKKIGDKPVVESITHKSRNTLCNHKKTDVAIIKDNSQDVEYFHKTKMVSTQPVSSALHPVNASALQEMVTVCGLRFWSNPDYTRVVIDADHETTYMHHLLKKDPLIHKPQRLYVDLDQSRMGKDIPNHIPINDDLLINARAGQYTKESVRVVIDIKSFKDYKIFSLKNPFRIVIDVWGKEKTSLCSVTKTPIVATIPSDPQTGALAKQLALCVNRIVIDPGHGGRDYGAKGYLKGVYEKDIVLEISKKLAQLLRQQLNCEVILTRKDDHFLTLEERTAIANTRNADLFISVHANAAHTHRAYGIETYFLNLATDDDAISVAARENATSTKNISDLQSILNDLMQNAKITESSRLAGYVQNHLYSDLKKKYSNINNKGVKQAPFYVLLGARMPAILIETSFISNPRECKRLINSDYQDELCRSIAKGVVKYIDEINPTARRNRDKSSRPLAGL
jgi:N-acetylmuramoyl-L-alanine amidase